MRTKFAFAALFLILLAISWMTVIPIFQAPDEQAHFYYVQYIVEHRSLPGDDALSPSRGIASEQLEKILNLLGFNKIIHTRTQTFEFSDSTIGIHEQLLRNNNWKRINVQGLDYFGFDYPPLYYFLNVPAYLLFRNDVISQFFAMRLISVVLFAWSAFFVWKCFLQLFKEENLALPAALSLAVFPMYTFISVSVNNDVLINFLFMLFFYLLIRYWKKDLDFVFLLSISGIMLAAYFTKYQSFFMPFFLLLFLFFRPKGKMLFKNRDKGFWSYAAVLGISLVLIIKGIFSFFGRFQYYYTNIVSYIGSLESPVFEVGRIFLSRYSRVFKSFFARYGWLDTLVAGEYYLLFGFLTAIFLLCLVIYLWKKSADRLAWFLISCVLIVDTAFSMLYFVNGAISGVFSIPNQGRYYFFVLLPLFLLFYKCVQYFLPKKMVFPVFLTIFFLVLFFNLLSLVYYVVPRFYI